MVVNVYIKYGSGDEDPSQKIIIGIVWKYYHITINEYCMTCIQKFWLFISLVCCMLYLLFLMIVGLFIASQMHRLCDVYVISFMFFQELTIKQRHCCWMARESSCSYGMPLCLVTVNAEFSVKYSVNIACVINKWQIFILHYYHTVTMWHCQ